MYTVFAFLTRLRRPSLGLSVGHHPAPVDSVAASLMERAEARAGLDPRQAQDLRRAASAYLSVVR